MSWSSSYRSRRSRYTLEDRKDERTYKVPSHLLHLNLHSTQRLAEEFTLLNNGRPSGCGGHGGYLRRRGDGKGGR